MLLSLTGSCIAGGAILALIASILLTVRSFDGQNPGGFAAATVMTLLGMVAEVPVALSIALGFLTQAGPGRRSLLRFMAEALVGAFVCLAVGSLLSAITFVVKHAPGVGAAGELTQTVAWILLAAGALCVDRALGTADADLITRQRRLGIASGLLAVAGVLQIATAVLTAQLYHQTLAPGSAVSSHYVLAAAFLVLAGAGGVGASGFLGARSWPGLIRRDLLLCAATGVAAASYLIQFAANLVFVNATAAGSATAATWLDAFSALLIGAGLICASVGFGVSRGRLTERA